MGSLLGSLRDPGKTCFPWLLAQILPSLQRVALFLGNKGLRNAKHTLALNCLLSCQGTEWERKPGCCPIFQSALQPSIAYPKIQKLDINPMDIMDSP